MKGYVLSLAYIEACDVLHFVIEVNLDGLRAKQIICKNIQVCMCVCVCVCQCVDLVCYHKSQSALDQRSVIEALLLAKNKPLINLIAL